LGKGEGGGDVVTMEAEFVVACDEAAVDPALFACLNDAGIVFDGHVVIDAAFRTNDPHVYATGAIAKFSRRYGPGHLPLRYHNAREVGFRLGDSLIAAVCGAAPALVPPALTQPRAESTILPGKFQFLYIAAPQAFVSPTFEHPAGGRSLVTKDDAFCRLDVDAGGTVVGFYYCGEQRVDAAALAGMIGLPVSYLAVDEPYKKRQVGDLLQFLQKPALSAVFHEKFAQRHRSLLALLQAGGTPGAGAPAAHSLLGPVSLKGVVQDVVLDFVKMHAHDLPTYHAAEL